MVNVSWKMDEEKGWNDAWVMGLGNVNGAQIKMVHGMDLKNQLKKKSMYL